MSSSISNIQLTGDRLLFQNVTTILEHMCQNWANIEFYDIMYDMVYMNLKTVPGA